MSHYWIGSLFSGKLTRSLCAMLVAAIAAPALAADSERAGSRRAADNAEVVELFAGIEAGDIEVKVIPKNAKEATIIINNKKDRPLRIQMPKAMAGVPVLAQLGGGLGGGLGGQGGGGQQGMGMGGGMGGGMMGGGMFNVPAERQVKVKVPGVCLEHGKDDPNPRIEYKLVPIESFTDSYEVIEILAMLGAGQIDQASAQAAAWHYTDGLSWQELASKVGVKHLNGTVTPFFTPAEIERAMRIAGVAKVRAGERETKPSEPSPGVQAAR